MHRQESLEDDQEWDRALADAVALLMPRQCRQLFVTILTHCQPSEPHVLWERYKTFLSEDFARHQSVDVAIECALADIEKRLSESGMSCMDRGLPAPNLNIVADSDIDHVDDAAIASRNMAMLNEDQEKIVNEILNEALNGDNDKPNIHYLDGPAGTGKTMVFNTLISVLKSQNVPVAACAWTGIASILLRTGVTVHNLFKLPVPILDTSSCRISPASPYADFLKSLKLIVIDEASMIPNDATHAIDRALRDIMDNDIPFGGKLILFGGDFRQVLPVVVRGTATKILEKCLKRSHLWPVFKIHNLTKNMRALVEEREFSKWLLQMGNGNLQSSSVTDDDMIDIPAECLVDDLVDELFPDFSVDRQMSVILTPKNETSLKLNDKILERLPGIKREFFSCDKALCDDEEEAQNYPLEFLNSITPTGMPPHKLILKKGCTVMLLRNLSSKRGLCNGVRLEVLNIHNAVLHCKILTGSHIGEEVLIPKLKLAPSDANLPFVLQRIQFPIQLSYSMTINKSQGQTFDHVGILLEEPVFSHGQLYVAFSRARTLNGVKVKVGNDGDKSGHVTKNVVYRDIL